MTHVNPQQTTQLTGELVALSSTQKYSKAWWKDTADRVVSTTAQTALATITASAIPGLLDIDPVSLASVALLGGALAFLKALAVTNKAKL